MVIFGIINSLLTLSDILSKQGVTYSPQRKKLIFFASVIGMREVDEIPVDQIQSVFLEQISEKWGSEASVNRPISSVRNELYYTIAFQNEDEIHYGAKHDNFPMLENCAIELAKDFKIPYQGIRRNGMFFNS